jgi:hypothetical protein
MGDRVPVNLRSEYEVNCTGLTTVTTWCHVNKEDRLPPVDWDTETEVRRLEAAAVLVTGGEAITSEMILDGSTLRKAAADDCRSPNTFTLQVHRIEMDHRQEV